MTRRIIPVYIAALFLSAAVTVSWGIASAKGKQPFIIDYQEHLNKRYKKISRQSTRYIIVHTSEAGLASTLRTLSRGKSIGRYRTIGGHAHYAIARDGKVYRILHHRFRADHAGLSMWDGLEDISSHSLGIELIGYHYDTITGQQYSSLSRLLEILQQVYNVPDKDVLTHSQVSYGRPNLWFKRPHRGRKRCALNFDREKAGLTVGWSDDPDVRAGRLARDKQIYAMFYKKSTPPASPVPAAVEIAANTVNEDVEGEKDAIEALSNVVGKDNTAWNIAGEDYAEPTTLYVLPNNRTVRGDRLGAQVGWNRIPAGTRVLLNQPMDIEEKKGPVFLITREYTAWSFAGPEYRKPTTFYFLPGGRVYPGNRISDWDSLPDGTRMIVGYKGPLTIQARRGKTPWGLAGPAHDNPETLYLIPGKNGKELLPGNKVENFSGLPRGAQLFLKVDN